MSYSPTFPLLDFKMLQTKLSIVKWSTTSITVVCTKFSNLWRLLEYQESNVNWQRKCTLSPSYFCQLHWWLSRTNPQQQWHNRRVSIMWSSLKLGETNIYPNRDLETVLKILNSFKVDPAGFLQACLEAGVKPLVNSKWNVIFIGLGKNIIRRRQKDRGMVSTKDWVGSKSQSLSVQPHSPHVKQCIEGMYTKHINCTLQVYILKCWQEVRIAGYEESWIWTIQLAQG